MFPHHWFFLSDHPRALSQGGRKWQCCDSQRTTVSFWFSCMLEFAPACPVADFALIPFSLLTACAGALTASFLMYEKGSGDTYSIFLVFNTADAPKSSVQLGLDTHICVGESSAGAQGSKHCEISRRQHHDHLSRLCRTAQVKYFFIFSNEELSARSFSSLSLSVTPSHFSLLSAPKRRWI